MQEKKICPCCGAKLTGRFERVSRGLANSLIKFRKQVVKNKVNKVHLANDLELSKNEYNNFQKLRYHGLIAHYKCKETKEFLTGYWLLTHRGNKFCKNELHVPKKLLIFRNKIDKFKVWVLARHIHHREISHLLFLKEKGHTISKRPPDL